MPASAASLSSNEHPDSPQIHRSSLAGWAGAVGLVVLFALALIYFPPATDAAKAVPSPEWGLFLGRFHPIAVHLPVGVLMLGALMELLVFFRFPLGRALKPSVNFVMGIGALGAIVAVVFGILLSREGGYKGGMFQAHQVLGIATAVGAILTLIFKLISDDSGRAAFLYRGVMILTLTIMSVGAHFGGNMVHGSDYLLDHAPAEVRTKVREVEGKIVALFAPAGAQDGPAGAAPEPVIPPVEIAPAAAIPPVINPTVYAAIVAPLMESKCNSCHNADKSKGDLRLDTHEFILKGGENGDNVVAGDPVKSLLIARMVLPVDHDDHMPPENKPQPTAEEVAVLSWWVKQGASKEMKVAEAAFPEELKATVQALLAAGHGGSGGSAPPLFLAMAEVVGQVDLGVAEAMKKINGSGASLAPVAANAKELRFTALNVARDYTDANLKDLEPVAGAIVALDLAKTKVTDAALPIIAKMTNLKELHLENTAITDAAGASLKTLSRLEYLNLYGTKVTDKILADLDGLASLKSLYLWQTGVTKPAITAFKAKHPAMVVNIGWTDDDNAKVVAAPVPTPTPAPVVAAPAGKGDPNSKIYADIVAPILAAKCNSCHGEDKSKGKLKLHTLADALKGGGDGPTTVIAGNTKESLLLVRSKLPLDDDDHMPPSDKDQLTKEELALLEWWIEQGASDSLTVATAKKTPEIEKVALAYLASRKPAAAAVPVVAQQAPPKPTPAPAPPAKPVPAPVLKPVPAPAPPPAVAGKPVAADTKIFAEVVAPILAAKCNSCHGTEKSKGKLKMHTFADLLKGGSDGATTVIASNVKDSLLLVRAKLPKDDDEHMPPSDEPQLTKEELALLEWWVAEGASESATFGSAKKTPEIELMVKAFLSAKPATGTVAKKVEEKLKPKPLTEAEKKAVAAATARVTALNGSLMAIALDSEQLRLGTVNAADKFGDKELAELLPVAPHLVWADLARTKVTDAGLSVVSQMINLERLHLENTAITDAGLARLAGLAKLEYLNLYGTKITDAGLAKLASNKGLKKVFVWQTAVTRDAAKKLEAAVPGLIVNVGLSEAEIAKLVEAAQPPKPVEAPKPEAKKPEAKPVPAPAPPAKPEAKPVPTPAPTPKPEAKPAPAPAPPAKPEAKPVPAPAPPAKPEAKPVPAPAPPAKPDAPPPAVPGIPPAAQ